MTPNADRTPSERIPEHGPDAWIPLSDAAVRLGISYDAARRRIARGTLAAEKRHGRWYAFVADADPGPDPDPNARPDATGPRPDAMFAVLQDEVTFLRGELSSRTEEIRRRDHIIAGLVERVKALPAGEMSTFVDTPQDRDPGPVRGVQPAKASTIITRVRRLLGRG